MNDADGRVILPRVMVVRVPGRVDDRLFDRLLAAVDPAKRARLLRYRARPAAVASLTADLLARQAASETLGLRRDRIAFAATPSGKPYLPGQPDYHFNLSHSGRWVVAAEHPSQVGVDVEAVARRHIPVEALAKRFLSPLEAAGLLALPAEERLVHFLDLWTLKESYVKALGDGLRVSLSSFTIQKTGDGAIALLRHDPLLPSYTFVQYDIDSACRLSVCAAAGAFAPVADRISFADVCAGFGVPADE